MQPALRATRAGPLSAAWPVAGVRARPKGASSCLAHERAPRNSQLRQTCFDIGVGLILVQKRANGEMMQMMSQIMHAGSAPTTTLAQADSTGCQKEPPVDGAMK